MKKDSSIRLLVALVLLGLSGLVLVGVFLWNPLYKEVDELTENLLTAVNSEQESEVLLRLAEIMDEEEGVNVKIALVDGEKNEFTICELDEVEGPVQARVWLSVLMWPGYESWTKSFEFSPIEQSNLSVLEENVSNTPCK